MRHKEGEHGAPIETAGGARSANVQRTREPYGCWAVRGMCGQCYSSIVRVLNIEHVEAAIMALAWPDNIPSRRSPLRPGQSWGFWANPGRNSPIKWM